MSKRPVRGPEFGPNSNLVRLVVRISVRKTGSDFFRSGPWSGAKFQKIVKIKGSFHRTDKDPARTKIDYSSLIFNL